MFSVTNQPSDSCGISNYSYDCRGITYANEEINGDILESVSLKPIFKANLLKFCLGNRVAVSGLPFPIIAGELIEDCIKCDRSIKIFNFHYINSIFRYNQSVYLKPFSLHF